MAEETLTEQAFERVADEALHRLEGALEELDGLEVSLEMGILTLEFPDATKYVINSHRAARQIWMAAERNAWHFDYQPVTGHTHPPETPKPSAQPVTMGETPKPPAQPALGRWIAARNGDELWSTIAAVTSRKLGRPVSLGTP